MNNYFLFLQRNFVLNNRSKSPIFIRFRESKPASKPTAVTVVTYALAYNIIVLIYPRTLDLSWNLEMMMRHSFCQRWS